MAPWTSSLLMLASAPAVCTPDADITMQLAANTSMQ